MNQLQHKTLTAGDVRQKGDETRHLTGCVYPLNYEHGIVGPCSKDWFSVPSTMLGQRILPADLIASAYRRPL